MGPGAGPIHPRPALLVCAGPGTLLALVLQASLFHEPENSPFVWEEPETLNNSLSRNPQEQRVCFNLRNMSLCLENLSDLSNCALNTSKDIQMNCMDHPTFTFLNFIRMCRSRRQAHRGVWPLLVVARLLVLSASTTQDRAQPLLSLDQLVRPPVSLEHRGGPVTPLQAETAVLSGSPSA